jgi:hypothetical protein
MVAICGPDISTRNGLATKATMPRKNPTTVIVIARRS